ncbi:MAG: hypothetical protein K5695_10425 [Oscillospiraceae bacterium]|nr:hypothetical protein [Oscillospiraceae bacterium]
MKLPDLSPLEWGILAAGAVLSLGALAAGLLTSTLGWFLAVPAPFLVSVMLAALHHLQRIRKLLDLTLPATARIVDEREFVSRTTTRFFGSFILRGYRPIVEFETEQGTVREEYPINTTTPWYSYDKEYQIFYNPEQPAYFYFADRREERLGDLKYDLSIAVGFVVGYLVVAILTGWLLNDLFGL